MNEISWTSDQLFTDSHDNTVHMLQRPLAREDDELLMDMLPFLENLSMYQYRTDGKNAQKGMGQLKNFHNKNNSFEVSIAQDSSVHELSIIDPQLTLTVWRVNNALDALQININGINGELYFQIGGKALLALYDAGLEADLVDPKLYAAVQLFVQNVPMSWYNPL